MKITAQKTITHYFEKKGDYEVIWPFDQSMFLILNIAIGSDWGGYNGVDDAIFPHEMEIDYVRIFKKQ